jgi:hypothetical protein
MSSLVLVSSGVWGAATCWCCYLCYTCCCASHNFLGCTVPCSNDCGLLPVPSKFSLVGTFPCCPSLPLQMGVWVPGIVMHGFQEGSFFKGTHAMWLHFCSLDPSSFPQQFTFLVWVQFLGWIFQFPLPCWRRRKVFISCGGSAHLQTVSPWILLLHSLWVQNRALLFANSGTRCVLQGPSVSTFVQFCQSSRIWSCQQSDILLLFLQMPSHS